MFFFAVVIDIYGYTFSFMARQCHLYPQKRRKCATMPSNFNINSYLLEIY